MPVEISIERAVAQEFWICDARRALQMVRIDPDDRDGQQRWPDKDSIRWKIIGDAAMTLLKTVRSNSGTDYVVTVSLPLELSRDEYVIVDGWIGRGGPTGSPWEGGVNDGRHRIWNCVQAGCSVLPLRHQFSWDADDLANPNFVKFALEDLADNHLDQVGDAYYEQAARSARTELERFS